MVTARPHDLCGVLGCPPWDVAVGEQSHGVEVLVQARFEAQIGFVQEGVEFTLGHLEANQLGVVIKALVFNVVRRIGQGTAKCIVNHTPRRIATGRGWIARGEEPVRSAYNDENENRREEQADKMGTAGASGFGCVFGHNACEMNADKFIPL